MNERVPTLDREVSVNAIDGVTGNAGGPAVQIDLSEIIGMAEQLGSLPDAPLGMPKQALERSGLRESLRAFREGRGIFGGWRAERQDMIIARAERQDAPQGMRFMPSIRSRADR